MPIMCTDVGVALNIGLPKRAAVVSGHMVSMINMYRAADVLRPEDLAFRRTGSGPR